MSTTAVASNKSKATAISPDTALASVQDALASVVTASVLATPGFDEGSPGSRGRQVT